MTVCVWTDELLDAAHDIGSPLHVDRDMKGRVRVTIRQLTAHGLTVEAAAFAWIQRHRPPVDPAKAAA